MRRRQGAPPRGLVAVTVMCVAAVLAAFISAPAYAATAPAVNNPGPQTSPTKVALSLAMTASGGTTPYAWSATGLPAGLTINASSGVISGTPSTASTYSTTVTAKDATNTPGSTSFTWKTGVVVTNPGIRGTKTGTAGSLTMTAKGGTTPYTWSATGLPTGLTISSSTGAISGTASTAGTYTPTVTARDAAAVTGSTSFTWNVGPAPAVTSPGNQTSPTKVALNPLTISASGGTAPYAWSASGLPAGLSINASTGVVSGTATTAGTSTATVTATDAKMIPGSVTFTWTAGVVVSNPGARGSATGVAVNYPNTAVGGTTPYTWSATGLPAGLAINASTGTITGTATTASTYSTTITAKDAAAVTGTASFTWKTGPAPAVTNPGAQTGTVGTAVSKTLTATGGTTPYTWSATNLPAGLSINASTGAITGTPTTAGTATVTVTATGANTVPGSTAFSWTVAAPVTVTDPGPQAATTGTAVSKTITAAGGSGSYTWSASGLPAGLTISASTGTIAGTSSTAGTSTVTVTAKDAVNRTATTTFTWTVTVALTVTNPGAQTATTGTATTLNLSAAGGTSPYTWTATGLPAGLSINATTGAITGTPTTVGTSTMTVTVTDAGNRTTSMTFAWTIGAPVGVAAVPAQTGTVGVAATPVTVTATGGTAPYTWTAAGLPDGLTINTATGVISGTPSTALLSSVTVTATDTLNRIATTSFGWDVSTTPVIGGLTAPGSELGSVTQVTPTVTGGTANYTWTATGLPDGLAISASTGVISGTATTVGTVTATIEVTDARGRTAKTTVAWKSYAALPQNPVMDEGKVSRVAAVGKANGVTALGSTLFTAVGDRIIKIDAAGNPHDLAGGGTNGCNGNGSDVKLRTPRVFGNDGTLIYVSDPSCGVVSINPNSGDVRYVTSDFNNPSIVGHYLYTDNFYYLNRTDLITGQTTGGLTPVSPYANLVVDNDTVWDTQTTLTAKPLQSLTPTSTRISFAVANPISVGGYIYGVTSGNTVVRLRKTDLTTRIIAGISAYNDPPLFYITGIAAGNNKLYIADDYGLSAITAEALPYLPPENDHSAWSYATLKTTATLPVGTSGVTVLAGYAYTGADTQILKTDVKTGFTVALAGGGLTGSCADTATGAAATFRHAQVIGNDEHLIYVASSDCGIRAINPVTGATHYTLANFYGLGQGAIGGHTLYFKDSGNQLLTYDLQTGTTNLYGPICAWCFVTADDNGAWIINMDQHSLTKVTPTTVRGIPVTNGGTFSPFTVSLPPTGPLWGMGAMGDHVYVETFVPSADGQTERPALLAISEADGSSQVVQTLDGISVPQMPWNGVPAGIASDFGLDLYTLDSTQNGTTLLHLTISSDPGTDPARYLEPGTIFIPTNNTEATKRPDGTNTLPDAPRVGWNPETGLCSVNCAGIYAWRQKKYDTDGGQTTWHAITCTAGNCMPEDFERTLIAEGVASQGYFNSDGSLTASFKSDHFLPGCEHLAVDPMADCTLTLAEQETGKWETITQILMAIPPFLKGRGGMRPEPERILERGETYSEANENGAIIAEVEADGMFNCAVESYDPTLRGVGGPLFRNAIEAYGENVSGVRGSWFGTGKMKTNFDAYKANVAQGMTPQEAARGTFTGHMAGEYGYSTVRVVIDTAEKVVVEFTP